MVVVVFDSSTTCTGCSVAEISNGVLVDLKTLPLIPSNFTPSMVGFLNVKQDVINKGVKFKAYVTHKGEVISKTEAERRARNVKRAKSEHRVQSMITDAIKVIKREDPDIIIMESNMAFGRNDVTKLLAEVAGALQAIATSEGKEFEKIQVSTARGCWNLSKDLKEFVKRFPIDVLTKMDTTKELLKEKMLQEFGKFGISKEITLDESDSLVILYFWLRRENIAI